jgi:hypothetical protein
MHYLSGYREAPPTVSGIQFASAFELKIELRNIILVAFQFLRFYTGLFDHFVGAQQE